MKGKEPKFKIINANLILFTFYVYNVFRSTEKEEKMKETNNKI